MDSRLDLVKMLKLPACYLKQDVELLPHDAGVLCHQARERWLSEESRSHLSPLDSERKRRFLPDFLKVAADFLERVHQSCREALCCLSGLYSAT